jgi:hypothetical protein
MLQSWHIWSGNLELSQHELEIHMSLDPQTTFQGRKDSEIAVVLSRFERPGSKNKKDRKLTWPDSNAATNRNLQFLLETAGVTIPILPERKPRNKPNGYGAKGIIYILNAYPRTPKLLPQEAARRIKKKLMGRKVVIAAGEEACEVVRFLKKEFKEEFKHVTFFAVPHPSARGIKLVRDHFESWQEVGKYIENQGIEPRPCPKEKRRNLPEWRRTWAAGFPLY